MRIRWIALTGTPGVGKTMIARELRRLGLEVVDGKRFARAQGCIVGLDLARRSQIVDPRLVGRKLGAAFAPAPRVRVLETHWAHDVPGMDVAIVLRLNPRILEQRLASRRWPKPKVRENVEAEAMGIIAHEARENLGRRRVAQVDCSRRPAHAVARFIARVARKPSKQLTNLEIGRVDWTEELLRWY